MWSGWVPHIGGPILPACKPSVLIGGLPAARVGDNAYCNGPPDVIVQGSSNVFIGGQMAARMGDRTAHGGIIIFGNPRVWIGENGAKPAAPLSAGEVRNLLGSSAFPGQQSYGNCGVQSSEQVIFLDTGNRIPEKEILDQAISMGIAGTGNPADASSVGATSADGRKELLAHYGVQSTVQPTTREALGSAIRGGKGVIVNVNAGVLWNDDNVQGSHAIVVTDGTFDNDGNLQTVTVNDTGIGQRHEISAEHLMDAADARDGGSQMNVTNDRVFIP
jgi:uncharacterized Zn-binding protein involved in type VI secretion